MKKEGVIRFRTKQTDKQKFFKLCKSIEKTPSEVLQDLMHAFIIVNKNKKLEL